MSPPGQLLLHQQTQCKPSLRVSFNVNSEKIECFFVVYCPFSKINECCNSTKQQLQNYTPIVLLILLTFIHNIHPHTFKLCICYLKNKTDLICASIGLGYTKSQRLFFNLCCENHKLHSNPLY